MRKFHYVKKEGITVENLNFDISIISVTCLSLFSEANLSFENSKKSQTVDPAGGVIWKLRYMF